MKQKIYFEALDGVRGFAIILVIIWHYIGINWHPDEGWKTYVWIFCMQAWSGVDLFFVLSGFLITFKLIESKEDTHYFKNFYIKRFFRIIPAYYFLLFIFVCCFYLFHFSKSALFQDPMPLWSYFVFVQNFFMAEYGFGAQWLGITWSLALEEQFYLLFPLAIYFIKNDKLPWIFILGYVFSVFLRYYFSKTNTGLYGYTLLFSRLDSLFSGAFLALIYFNFKSELFLNKKLINILFAVLFIFGLVFIFGFKRFNMGGTIIHAYFSIFYTFLILVSLTKSIKSISKVFSSSVLKYIGKLSYSIYLWHQFSIFLIFEFVLNKYPILNTSFDFVFVLISLFLTWILANISYFLIEKPFLEMRKKY